MSDVVQENITWNPSLEVYFKETGEKAHGLAWLHRQCEIKFTNLKTPLDLSAIIIGAVNGFISVGSSQIFEDFHQAPLIIGTIGLFVRALNTISSYYAYGKRIEAHRITAIQYSKLSRLIKVEMGLPRSERVPPSTFIKLVKDSYDRLAEIAPIIPPQIIKRFQTEFKAYPKVKRPSETNGLEEISIYQVDGASDRTNTE
jgi:hypothetical protein